MIWSVPLLVFIVLMVRYALLSGLAYAYFWKWRKEKFSHRRIQRTFPKTVQVLSELKWSISTFAVFSLGVLFLYPPITHGKTQLYLDIGTRGWAYLFLSMAVLVLTHDFYFYWIHRFMHVKWVFKHVHRVHHESTNPSPLAAFSFHPIEALIEGAFVGVAIFLIPLHPVALGAFLLFSNVMNVMGHLGYEIYPRVFTKHPVLGLFNSSTHHNMHHQYFTSNYGLYFTFWDGLLGTNHPRYHKVVEGIVAREKPVKAILLGGLGNGQESFGTVSNCSSDAFVRER